LSGHPLPCFANFAAPFIAFFAVIFFANRPDRVGLSALAVALFWVAGVSWFWIFLSSLYQIDIS